MEAEASPSNSTPGTAELWMEVVWELTEREQTLSTGILRSLRHGVDLVEACL